MVSADVRRFIGRREINGVDCYMNQRDERTLVISLYDYATDFYMRDLRYTSDNVIDQAYIEQVWAKLSNGADAGVNALTPSEIAIMRQAAADDYDANEGMSARKLGLM